MKSIDTIDESQRKAARVAGSAILLGIVIVVVADAAAGAATPSAPATMRATERRRFLLIEQELRFWFLTKGSQRFDNTLDNTEARTYHNPDRFDPDKVVCAERLRALA